MFKRKQILWTGIAVGLIVVILGVFLTYTLQGKEEDTLQSPKVKVMVIMPVGREVGQDMLNGAKLALQEANGKAGDTTVEFVVRDSYNPDDPWSIDLTLHAAQEAVADKDIVAVLGATNSGEARQMIPLLNTVPMALISPLATWPGLTKLGYAPGEPSIYYPGGQYNFFRVVPSDDVQGLVAARWLGQQGMQRIFIVTEDTVYSDGLAGIMEVNVRDQGLETVGHEVFKASEASPEEIENLATRILAADPDVIYYPVTGGTGGFSLIETLRQKAPDVVIMASDGLVGEDVPEDITLVEGIYATNVIIPVAQLESATSFVAAYQNAYGKAPLDFSLPTYEAARALLKALETVKEPTRENVLKALHDVGEMTGPTGTWHFDENGDTTLTMITILQLREGKWELVDIVE